IFYTVISRRAAHPPSLPSFPTRRSSDLLHPAASRVRRRRDVRALRVLREQHHGRVPIRRTQRLAAAPCESGAARESHGDDVLLRSEEHTSELQSPDHLVCRLLLEKKNYI